jgi:hypothetical protein
MKEDRDECCNSQRYAVAGASLLRPNQSDGSPRRQQLSAAAPTIRDRHLACLSRGLEDCTEAAKVLAVSVPDRDRHERRCQAGEPGWLTAVPQAHAG